jgi:hypothetical protein
LQSNSSCFKRVKGGARALLSGLVRNSSWCCHQTRVDKSSSTINIL